MKGLSLSARVFLFGIYTLAGILLYVTFFVYKHPGSNGSLWELAAYVVLAVVAGHTKVNLIRSLKDKGAGSMSLGFAMIFATLLRFGPYGAVIAGIGSTVYSCIRPRQPWYQFCFNVSINIIETATSGFVFVQMNHGTLALHSLNSALAVMATSLVFFFINTGSVASIIALCTQTNAVKTWIDSLMWTAPSYFIGAGVSTLATLVVGNRLVATLLCAAPIAYLTHSSFRAYLMRANALIESKQELANLYLSTIRSLALAIDAKDQHTHQHILRVQQYAVATALQMGISGDELNAIETGALLHDIGKLGVPEYVLLKPGRLTPEEYEKIKEHPTIGADILDPVKFPWPVLPVVKYHHERWDGTGYPEGLKGEEIPRTARILAVSDVYDALTLSRSYRSAWTHERAMEEIRDKSGSFFEPVVVENFCLAIEAVRERMAGDGPLSSLSPSKGGTTDPISTPRSVEAVRHIQRTSSELWALYEVAQTLSASLGLDDTLEILGRKLLAIFPDTGCVFLLRQFGQENDGIRSDPSGTTVLHARSAVGLNQEFFRNSCTLGVGSRSATVAAELHTYVGPYDHEDLLPTSSPTSVWTEIGTSMIIPIVHQGESLGTINLYHPGADAFGPHIQSLMETIVERAAMALYNGLMFDRTRSHAITDPLTGLANIRNITEWIEHRIQNAAPESERFALLCLDLDSFKPINDNFGHLKGDIVLRDLADLFRGLVRDGDLVGRNGGDEFVILLQDAGHHEAVQMMDRIQMAVQNYNPRLHHSRLGHLRLGVSIGTSCFPEDGADTTTLLSTADAAMYKNKTDRKLQHLAENSFPALPTPFSQSYADDARLSEPFSERELINFSR